MRALLAVAALALLSGCATLTGGTTTAKVIVKVPCEAPVVEKPVLPVDSLNVGDDVYVVNRALWATDELREGYEIKLQAALDACRRDSANKADLK